MFIQLHMLNTLPVHIPNRGGDGLAKRAVVAGIERQRISYQAQQYALRHSPEFEAIEVPAEIGRTVRSADIGERRMQPAFEKEGVTNPEAWADAVMALWRKKEDANKKKADDGEEKKAPLIVGEQEVRLFTAVVKTCDENKIKPEQLRALMEKQKAPKGTPEAVAEAIYNLKHHAKSAAGLDGSLFGRMVTGIAVATIERCVRFSDALTTHAITPVNDFFLVTDDLKSRDAGEAGGSHISSREMAAGLFYRHVTIDTKQMETNGVPVDVLTPLISALLTVSPIGNRSSARLVDAFLEIGGQVRSLMDAYGDPVSAPAAAAERLRAFVEDDYATYGKPHAAYWLSEMEAPRVSKLAALAGTEVAGVGRGAA